MHSKQIFTVQNYNQTKRKLEMAEFVKAKRLISGL